SGLTKRTENNFRSCLMFTGSQIALNFGAAVVDALPAGMFLGGALAPFFVCCAQLAARTRLKNPHQNRRDICVILSLNRIGATSRAHGLPVGAQSSIAQAPESFSGALDVS